MTPQSASLPPAGRLRVALVHYWFTARRGGERVLEELARLFPEADLFTLFYDPEVLAPALRQRKIRASFLQHMPGILRTYKNLMALYPLALRALPLREYDLVLSHESGPAKGFRLQPRALHISYTHTPMRYVWDMYEGYRAHAPLGALGRAVYSLSSHYLRRWDARAAARVHHFVASSHNGAARVARFYLRQAEVIYPPVETASFAGDVSPEDFYLVVSPLVAYKRVDLAIAACNRLQRRLVVIGKGEEAGRLQRQAGPTVTLLGFQPDDVVRDHYRRCRALLFPGEEDIGLVPIEAQASGRPVIAFGRGGALETVLASPRGEQQDAAQSTGLFFPEPTADSLVETILKFERLEQRFSPVFIRQWAGRFDTAHFRRAMSEFVARKLEEHHRNLGQRAEPDGR